MTPSRRSEDSGNPALMRARDDIETLLPDFDGAPLDLRFDAHFRLEHLPHRQAELNGLADDAANA
ncbi:MAG TPA: hypothetical protein VLS27_05270 [Gammaproteobacteria bacterium]|nr:hypothetical protein [Gammaproteobacteria bacterium]